MRTDPLFRGRTAKRLLEIGSGIALLVLVAGLIGGWLYYKSLNDALVKLMELPGLDRNQRKELHRLLGKGASFHARRSDGYNVLMLAARNGELELIRTALDRGIPVNARGGEGWTPLIEATHSGSEECIRTLIAAGADVNGRDAHGRTPLLWAGWGKNRRMIMLLLDQGADIKARSIKGEGVLTYVGPSPALVRWLKQRGAVE